jgi:hypothetical protein
VEGQAVNALMQLKEIAEKQKSVRTSRLEPLLKEIEMMYINQGKRISNQKKKLTLLQMESNRRKQFQTNKEKRLESKTK